MAVTKKTLAEAISITGRSKRTLRRWASLGCNLASRTSLEDFAARSMRRSRGKAIRQIVRTQAPVAAAVAKNAAPLLGHNGENGQNRSAGPGQLAFVRFHAGLRRTTQIRVRVTTRAARSPRVHTQSGRN